MIKQFGTQKTFERIDMIKDRHFLSKVAHASNFWWV